MQEVVEEIFILQEFLHLQEDLHACLMQKIRKTETISCVPKNC